MKARWGVHLIVAGVTVTASCLVYSDDLLLDGPASGGAGGATTTGVGGGGGASTTNVGGSGGSGGLSPDLNWPLDDNLPTRCNAQPADNGTSWTGWGNLQFPATIDVIAGQTTAAIYGRTYQAGATDSAGQAAGWEAELAVGPFGTLPDGEARCYSFSAAAFNVDVGNDDEYEIALTPSQPGIYNYFFRYRPPGGAWRYGDLNGSDDGIALVEGGRMVVAENKTVPSPLVVATLNLGCRTADWSQRRALVVEALARIDPDLVGFQEDCAEGTAPTQSEEVRSELSSYTRRGYDRREVAIEQVDLNGQTYETRLSILSAHPVLTDHWIQLPHEAMPAKALAVDVVIRGQPIRFYTTQLEDAPNLVDVRRQGAQEIAGDLPAGAISIVTGDLGAGPDEGVANVIATDVLRDAWSVANPSQAGPTFPAASPLDRVDYVLATKALVEGALLGAKQLDASSGSTWLSDHRGVAIAFTVP